MQVMDLAHVKDHVFQAISVEATTNRLMFKYLFHLLVMQVQCVIKANPFNCISIRTMRARKVNLVDLTTSLSRIAIIRTLFFQGRNVMLMPQINLHRQLQICAMGNGRRHYLIHRVILLTRIHVRITVPRILITANTTDPLPLYFYQGHSLRANLFTRFPTRFRDVIMTSASGELFQFVNQVSLGRIIFPLLVSRATIIVQRSGIRLFIHHFRLNRPRNFISLRLNDQVDVQFTAMAARRRFANQSASRVSFRAQDSLGRLANFLLLDRRFLSPIDAREPAFRLRNLFLCEDNLFERCQNSQTLFLRMINVINSFFLPISANSIHVLINRFLAALSLIRSLVEGVDRCIHVRVALIKDIMISPIVGHLPFLVNRFRIIVTFLRRTCRFTHIKVVFMQLRGSRITFTSLAVRVQVRIRVEHTVA